MFHKCYLSKKNTFTKQNYNSNRTIRFPRYLLNSLTGREKIPVFPFPNSRQGCQVKILLLVLIYTGIFDTKEDLCSAKKKFD